MNHAANRATEWRALFLAALLAVALTTCESADDGADAQARGQSLDSARPTAPSAGSDTTRDGTDTSRGRSIRPDGIGHVVPGMTIGQLRATLPAGVELGEPRPYMVDIEGMPVVAGEDTLYMVLIVAGESSSDDARINLVATTDTTMRTREGIGPGSTLSEAAAAYGSPTLTYSTNDESREYASFQRLPPTIRFRVRPVSDDALLAGDYDTEGEYNETGRYDPDAVVWMVMVLVP